MSKAKELADRLIRKAESGDTLDWRQIREEIHEAHDAAETEVDRVLCLRMHKSIMDAVEHQRDVFIKEGGLEDFRETRQRDYKSLLIKEANVGRTDGIITLDKLAAVTRREVAAGRMSRDDELHKLALAAEIVLPPPRRESQKGAIGAWFTSHKGGIGAWFASWFK